MIDERAIIDPSAKIGKDVTIGPFSIIGADVEIGDGTWVGPHAVISGPTRIGKNNKIFQFTSLGEGCQDKKYKGEDTILIIGDDNTFREFVTVSRGTVQDKGETRIGNRNLLMAYVHVAHDCTVGSDIVFSNNASLAGHVVVDDKANLGGFVGVHQFCHIGTQAFCAGGSIITKDVPPYVMVSGHPAQTHGLNSVGLKRRKISDESIQALKKTYKIFYRQGLTTEEALVKIEADIPKTEEVQRFLESIRRSERGLVR